MRIIVTRILQGHGIHNLNTMSNVRISDFLKAIWWQTWAQRSSAHPYQLWQHSWKTQHVSSVYKKIFGFACKIVPRFSAQIIQKMFPWTWMSGSARESRTGSGRCFTVQGWPVSQLLGPSPIILWNAKWQRSFYKPRCWECLWTPVLQQLPNSSIYALTTHWKSSAPFASILDVLPFSCQCKPSPWQALYDWPESTNTHKDNIRQI